MKPVPPSDLWDKMDAIHAEKCPEDPGFTINEYAERYSVTYDSASSKLARFVRDGKLKAGYRTVNGKRCRVFQPIE